MEITKAEILWTYKCGRRCSGCAMNTGVKNSRSLSDWILGINNIHKLGARFAAFYGAEPLSDFKNLPTVIQHTEGLGIATTVITAYPFTIKGMQRLQKLYKYGLRSLTTSYDIHGYDASSVEKSKQAIAMLEYFRTLGPIRDVAAVVTVTKDNLEFLPETVEFLTSRNIWMFCDLMHWDRGNPGTKCKGERKGSPVLSRYDVLPFDIIFGKLLNMKKEGYLIHIDEHTVEEIVSDGMFFKWNCADHPEFPSWITIGPDGNVFPCDDFKPDNPRFDMTKIHRQWDSFAKYYKKQVKKNCNGCLWCTHIQSHNIKRGVFSINDYVHTTG